MQRAAGGRTARCLCFGKVPQESGCEKGFALLLGYCMYESAAIPAGRGMVASVCMAILPGGPSGEAAQGDDSGSASASTATPRPLSPAAHSCLAAAPLHLHLHLRLHLCVAGCCARRERTLHDLRRRPRPTLSQQPTAEPLEKRGRPPG